MTCPVCGRVAPKDTFKYCAICGHRFGDRVPSVAADSPSHQLPQTPPAPPTPRSPAGPVRPAPDTPATTLTHGVTDAPVRIHQHDIAAGQPTATRADGGRLWVVRKVAAGFVTLHVTTANSAGELSGGTTEEYDHGNVSVLFDTAHAHGHLLAHVTLVPDDTNRVLHVSALTLRRWSHGHGLQSVPDDDLRYMDDAARVSTMTWMRNGVPVLPGDVDRDATGSGSWAPPTAHHARLYEHTVRAVHDFLVAMPDTPWRGYGLSHDPVRYAAFSETRRRR